MENNDTFLILRNFRITRQGPNAEFTEVYTIYEVIVIPAWDRFESYVKRMRET